MPDHSLILCPVCKFPADSDEMMDRHLGLAHGPSKPKSSPSKTARELALAWLLGDDTGTSSMTLCAHMLGLVTRWQSAPLDAADRGRCIRLLRLIPEWLPRLDEMAEVEEPSNSITITANGIARSDNSWAKQIPLIKSEITK